MFPHTGNGKRSEASTSTGMLQRCCQFEFDEILLATDNFNESLVVGKGGFGKVYKGNIKIGTTHVDVAIKRLDLMSNQGATEFWAEVEMLSKLRHAHLVSLIGYCNYEKEMILVYEYMPHGTLEDHLHKLHTPLSWLERLKICISAARGLDYLHTGTGIEVGVIHRDVKSSNILLHESRVAKISDFGLARIGPKNQSSTNVYTLVKGTFGYIDPNYFATGKLTRKSDVYAFGVVLFEVLCQKRPLDESFERGLATWIQESIKEGNLKHIVYSGIRSEISPKCLKGFARIAERCLDDHPNHRPTMTEVVFSLESLLAQSVLSLQQKTNNWLQTSGKKIFGRIFTQGQQQFSPSPYNNPTGARHLEQNYDVSRYTPERENGERNSLTLNSQMNQSLDYDNHQKFASRPVSGLSIPGIKGFHIIGDAKPGGRLLSCGFPVRGTSLLCMFQWVRHLQDGTREYIEAATNPEYIVTADDVDKLIAVECIPMDDQGRQGEIVRLFANEQNKITCDPEMQLEIDKYMSAGQASFILLLMDSSENWEQTTFSLRRSSYQIKINRTQVIIIDERYTNDLSIKIPSGASGVSSTQFVLTRPNGSTHFFNAFNDVRMRDTVVLTMRMFQSKALDERRKTKA